MYVAVAPTINGEVILCDRKLLRWLPRPMRFRAVGVRNTCVGLTTIFLAQLLGAVTGSASGYLISIDIPDIQAA